MYAYRLFTGYYGQDFDDLVILMNDHLTKDVPQETMFQLDYPWITNKKDTKLYILEHLDSIKLSRSHYIAISVINYGLYIDNLFALEILAMPSIDSLLMFLIWNHHWN